jgi:hypothetical protein
VANSVVTLQIMGSVHERSTRGALPESVESAVDGLLSRPPLFILSRASLASIPTNNPVTTFIRKIFLEDVYGTPCFSPNSVFPSLSSPHSSPSCIATLLTL